MIAVVYIVKIFCILGLLFSAFMLVKNNITYKNSIKISNAIHEYHKEQIKEDKPILVRYNDMEDYDSTLFRLWDFGYKHILPEDKFKIIEPYIK